MYLLRTPRKDGGLFRVLPYATGMCIKKVISKLCEMINPDDTVSSSC